MARVNYYDKQKIIQFIKEALEGIESPPNQAIKKKKFIDGDDTTDIVLTDHIEGLVAWIFAEDGTDKQVIAMYLGNQICAREACEMMNCRKGMLDLRINQMLDSTVDRMPQKTAKDLLVLLQYRELKKHPSIRIKGCQKCKGDQMRQSGDTMKGCVWHCIACGLEVEMV